MFIFKGSILFQILTINFVFIIKQNYMTTVLNLLMQLIKFFYIILRIVDNII